MGVMLAWSKNVPIVCSVELIPGEAIQEAVYCQSNGQISVNVTINNYASEMCQFTITWFLIMVSLRQNPFGNKHLNSQARYIIMKLWEYFEQEAKKSSVSVNLKRKISNATGKWFALLKTHFIVPCRDFNGIYYANLSGIQTEGLSVDTKEEVHSCIIAWLGSLVAPGTLVQECVLIQIDLTEMPLEGRSICCTETKKT